MANKCLTTQEIQQYLDRQLAAPQIKLIAQHLQSCTACRMQVETMRSLYESGASLARSERQRPVAPEVSAAVMQKIAQRQKQHKVPVKAETSWFELVNPLLKWVVAPAFAVLLVVQFFSVTEPVANKPVLTARFSLADNSVESLLADPTATVKLDDSLVKLSELKKINIGQKIELPAAAMIKVQVARHRITFSQQAQFSFASETLFLHSGKASLKLTGEHENFVVSTPFASVVPLGTEFETRVKDWFVKVELQKGKIKVANKKGEFRLIEGKGRLFIDRQGKFSNSLPGSTVPQSQPASMPPTRPQQQPSQNNNSAESLIDSF